MFGNNRREFSLLKQPKCKSEQMLLSLLKKMGLSLLQFSPPFPLIVGAFGEDCRQFLELCRLSLLPLGWPQWCLMIASTSYIMYTCNTYLSDICLSSGSLSSLLYFLLLLFSCRSDVLLRSLSLLCLRCLPRPSSLSRLQSLLRCLLCLSWSQSLSRDLSRLISLRLPLWSRLQSLSDRSDPQPLRGVRPGESSSLWLNSLPGLWYTCRKLQFLPRGHRFLSKRPAKKH